MSTLHPQTSESWRPYRPNYGHPTTGHVHEMHPYPYRRYSQHEEAGLVPQLGPRTGSIPSMKSNNGGYHSASPPPPMNNNTKNPSPPPMATNPMSVPSPPPLAAPTPALYRHTTDNASSASTQMQQQYHHRGPSNAATLASSAPTMAYPDTAALRTIPEHDVDSVSDAASRSSSRRRCCCCCYPCACLSDPPMWLRRLWEYVVLNRCLVYGLIAFVVCSVVFGIVFGVVIPNVAAAGGGGELSALSSSTGTLPTAAATPTSTTESSTSSTTTSTTSSATPLPTNLPQQCQPSRHTTPVSWMGIAGATGGWSFSFSSAESPAECCLHCFTQVDGCNGWQFTPGSATSCTVIEGWEGQKNGDWDRETCPDGIAGVQFRKQGQGVREGSAGGAGPCGKVSGSQ
ncbi:hypothetical protein MCOR20_009267 [Pyricularia oryzae]|nr:hypothetical protein MCOR20_009267 [Pyricularia oryzae]